MRSVRPMLYAPYAICALCSPMLYALHAPYALSALCALCCMRSTRPMLYALHAPHALCTPRALCALCAPCAPCAHGLLDNTDRKLGFMVKIIGGRCIFFEITEKKSNLFRFDFFCILEMHLRRIYEMIAFNLNVFCALKSQSPGGPPKSEKT